jgi:hypothetical protein
MDIDNLKSLLLNGRKDETNVYGDVSGHHN